MATFSISASWKRRAPLPYANDGATYDAYRASYVRELQVIKRPSPYTGERTVTWWREVIRDARGRVVWASLQRGLVRPSDGLGTLGYTRDALHRMRLRYYRTRVRQQREEQAS